MEILIPGLILVALMVYASTRIKRTAAEAFESETIETDEFIIQKPEGMLNIINGRPQFVFEAYSRDYGKDDAAEIRQVTSELVISEEPIDAVLQKVKVGGIVSEFSELIDGIKYHIVELEAEDKGNSISVTHKIAEKNGKCFNFVIRQLAASDDDNQRRGATLLNGFGIK